MFHGGEMVTLTEYPIFLSLTAKAQTIIIPTQTMQFPSIIRKSDILINLKAWI